MSAITRRHWILSSSILKLVPMRERRARPFCVDAPTRFRRSHTGAIAFICQMFMIIDLLGVGEYCIGSHVMTSKLTPTTDTSNLWLNRERPPSKTLQHRSDISLIATCLVSHCRLSSHPFLLRHTSSICPAGSSSPDSKLPTELIESSDSLSSPASSAASLVAYLATYSIAVVRPFLSLSKRSSHMLDSAYP